MNTDLTVTLSCRRREHTEPDLREEGYLRSTSQLKSSLSPIEGSDID